MEKEFYSEKEACETIRPIIDAIQYCHSLNIIHRDIKVLKNSECSNTNSLKTSFIQAKIPPQPSSKYPISDWLGILV